MGRRLADRAHGTSAWGIESQAPFRRSVELENLDVEARREIIPDTGRHARAEHVANRVVGVVRARRLGIDGGSHATQQVEDRALVTTQDLPQTRLGELPADYRAQPQVQRVAKCDALGIGVSQAQPCVGSVARAQSHLFA
ncbi:hypothetical protein D9M70_438530 [compost metagenome]